jgi:hypothetical protein
MVRPVIHRYYATADFIGVCDASIGGGGDNVVGSWLFLLKGVTAGVSAVVSKWGALCIVGSVLYIIGCIHRFVGGG